MTAAWRALAVVALAASLSVCRLAGGGEPSAVRLDRDTDPGGAPRAVAVVASAASAAPAPPGAPAPDAATTDPAPATAPALRPAACAQLRRRVEQQLVAAQQCQTAGDCTVESFEYAFRPCGLSVKKGAPLDQVRADAKRYQDRCHPVIRPVKCAYLPRATCDHGRCILAPPESG